MNRLLPILIVAIAVFLGLDIYWNRHDVFQTKQPSPKEMKIHELRGKATLLTDSVIGVFTSSETTEKDLLLFRDECKCMKGSDIEQLAAYYFQYCNILISMNKKKGELYREFNNQITHHQKETLSSTTGKRSTPDNKQVKLKRANCVAVQKWDVYCENRKRELKTLLSKISQEESELISQTI